jgi:hypothetical protein
MVCGYDMAQEQRRSGIAVLIDFSDGWSCTCAGQKCLFFLNWDLFQNFGRSVVEVVLNIQKYREDRNCNEKPKSKVFLMFISVFLSLIRKAFAVD